MSLRELNEFMAEKFPELFLSSRDPFVPLLPVEGNPLLLEHRTDAGQVALRDLERTMGKDQVRRYQMILFQTSENSKGSSASVIPESEGDPAMTRAQRCYYCGVLTSCRKFENNWYCPLHASDVKQAVEIMRRGEEEE